jgi:S1-C subfamily serine protease
LDYRGAQAAWLSNSVDDAGPAAEAGLRDGDVIVEANRQPVRSVNDLQSAVQKSGYAARVVVDQSR